VKRIADLSLLIVFIILGPSLLLAADRGTLVREAIIYLSPDATSNKLGQAERGRELVLLDRTPKWLHVEALLGLSQTPDSAFVMEEEDLQEQLSWPEVKTIIESAIDPVLSAQVYNPKKVNDWTTAIVESVLKGLQNLAKSYKYVVTCIIMQKNGAGLNTSSTCFWDAKTDGSCSVRWDNKTLHAIVTVFALHI